MTKYALAIFDNYTNVGDLIDYLKSKKYTDKISLLGINPEDQQVEDQLTGDEELNQVINEPFIGSLSGSVISKLDSVMQLNLLNIGNILVSGEIGDILAISPYISGEKKGDLEDALKDIGFSPDIAQKYADAFNYGQVVLIVKSPKSKTELISKAFQMFGALDYDIITFSPK